ncbi:MAG: hypothetical protein V1663_03775 [archaeon]
MFNKINKILRDIKSVRIQGAENIVKYGLKAYSLKPSKDTVNRLLRLRSTEPLLENSLRYAEKKGVKETLRILEEKEKKIIENGVKIIKNNSVIFTHCHSSTVMNILKEAKKRGKKFQVFSTETRPLYQGRKTAKELSKNKIKVTMIVDDAFHVALKKADLILIGADAILKKGVLNKIGSGLFAEDAYRHKVPLYVASVSWKSSNKNIKIEERKGEEIFKEKSKYIDEMNPAFELVNKKYIKAIICEYGILKYDKFLRKV